MRWSMAAQFTFVLVCVCLLFFFFIFSICFSHPIGTCILCEIGINYPNLLWCCSFCSYLLSSAIRLISFCCASKGEQWELCVRWTEGRGVVSVLWKCYFVSFSGTDTVCFWLFSIFPLSRKKEINYRFSSTRRAPAPLKWESVCVAHARISERKANGQRVHLTI